MSFIKDLKETIVTEDKGVVKYIVKEGKLEEG